MDKFIEYFYEISNIPHGSGNEGRISDYLKRFALENGFYVRQDDNDNIVIIREAHPDYANHEPVILQAHMDMVAVKTPESTKNMANEGLDLYDEDGFIKARGTSLGGDDGIGVAYILDILSGAYKTPRIEAIITTGEEVGMDGAINLSTEDITSKRMINLDQEKEGVFINSCAGGATVKMNLPVIKNVYDGSVYDIRVSGLKGGHSGEDINKNRGNAIKIIADELCKLNEKVKFLLVEINGGVAHNAIPNDVTAKVMLTRELDNSLFEKEILKLNGLDINFGDASNWDSAVISVTKEGSRPMIALDSESTTKALKFISEIPYGIIAMSELVPNMVETSMNTGVIKSDEESIYLEALLRSSIDRSVNELAYRLCKLCNEYGAEYSMDGAYPGWAASSDNELESIFVKTYEEMYGKAPTVKGIHAGLECGIFMGKIPDLKCISVGPDILDIHSVNERLDIESSKRCFELLVKVLEKL